MTPSKLQELIVKHVAGWADQHDEDAIKQAVYKRLDAEFEHIVMLSLGMKYDWGNWEANERSENWKKLQEAMAQHVSTYYKEITPPKLKPSLLAKVNKEVQDAFEYQFVRELRDACELPKDLIPKFLAKATEEFSSKKLEETIKLLKGNT